MISQLNTCHENFSLVFTMFDSDLFEQWVEQTISNFLLVYISVTNDSPHENLLWVSKPIEVVGCLNILSETVLLGSLLSMIILGRV
jgi:hypothetical protein